MQSTNSQQMKTMRWYQIAQIGMESTMVENSVRYERLTPAERRYMEQRQKIELQRLAKAAKKSHRDRIQEFNQYLANLSEHYDIPKAMFLKPDRRATRSVDRVTGSPVRPVDPVKKNRTTH